MPLKPRTLHLQVGEAPPPVRAAHGCFHPWLEAAWGGPLAHHDGRLVGPLPDLAEFGGVVVSGSASSLTAPEPWMPPLLDFLRDAHARALPVLGICFGHQLLGVAFGGHVVTNPAGWQVGSHTIKSELPDYLFDGLTELRFNMSHRDMVDPTTLLDAGRARVIASNPRCPVQALAVDEHVRGVQFHPEFSGGVMAGYLEARRDRLTQAGIDVDTLMAQAQDCPDGPRLVQNFRRGTRAP